MFMYFSPSPNMNCLLQHSYSYLDGYNQTSNPSRLAQIIGVLFLLFGETVKRLRTIQIDNRLVQRKDIVAQALRIHFLRRISNFRFCLGSYCSSWRKLLLAVTLSFGNRSWSRNRRSSYRRAILQFWWCRWWIDVGLESYRLKSIEIEITKLVISNAY